MISVRVNTSCTLLDTQCSSSRDFQEAVRSALQQAGQVAGQWAANAAEAKSVQSGMTGGSFGGFGGGGNGSGDASGGGGGYIGGVAGGRYAVVGTSEITGGGNFVHSTAALLTGPTLNVQAAGYVTVSYKVPTSNFAPATLGSVTLSNTVPYTADMAAYFASVSPMAFYVTSNPAGSATVYNSGVLGVAGNFRDMTYKVAVSASNASGEAVGRSTLDVTEPAPSPPVALSMGGVTLSNDTWSRSMASYVLDPQGSALTYYLETNPVNSAVMSSGTLKVSGDARQTTYAVDVSASNGYKLGARTTLSVTETGPLFTFTTFTFTSIDYTGNTAPNLVQHHMLVVPSSGTYTVTVVGGRGGRCTQRVGVGGFGGFMSARFRLAYGQVIIMLVGQKGGDGTVDECGGGGGTFVVTVGSNNVLTPLLVAGGGGGANKGNNGYGVTGLTLPGGSTGGGTTGTGADGFGYSSFQNNGLWGKKANSTSTQGGFGGGGIGPASYGGGGGGYQGGNGGSYTYDAGRGGWSYVSSHLPTYVDGSMSRNDNYNGNTNGWVTLARS
eukprot:gene17730-24090_t